MAAIGFIVGVTWPRLVGVRLGPSVPEAPTAALSSAGSLEPVAPSATASNGAVAAAAVVASAAAPTAPATALSLVATPSRGTVFACKSAAGEFLRAGECGGLPGLDGVVIPRLRKLADCPAAAELTASLHLVVRVDFERGVSVELGRNRGVAAPESLLACAKTAIAGASVASLPHDKPRYSVAYSVAFAPDAAVRSDVAAASSAPPVHDALQTAQVEWEAAIVRDEPKTGKIVARLPRGTALRLGPVKDGWYPIKFGDGFGTDGWVYRGAIGR